MSIKKNFFAPLASGLGATRRAAVLLLVMMLTMAQTAWAWTGSGTSESPYQITSESDLIQLATDVNGGTNYNNVYFRQTADIELSGEWTPIGTATNPFKGHYDGGGYAITGLQVTGSYQYAGLFGVIASGDYVPEKGCFRQAELKNIRIVECNINVGSGGNAGGIAGKASTIDMSGCRVSGTITGYSYAGGLIGYIDQTSGVKVTDCFVDVSVTSPSQHNPQVCLMANVQAGSPTASGNYCHDQIGNVSTGITATSLYTVTGAPSGVTVAETSATLTHNDTPYFAAGATTTLTVDDAHKAFNDNFSASGTGSSYTLAGNKRSATVTIGSGDVTVSATLRNFTYTVVFNGNGSTSGTMSSQAFEYSVSQNLTDNTFSRTGYTFAGWNTQANGSGDSYADKASVSNLTATDGGTVTLYAQWTPITYTITYNLDGGSVATANPATYTVETATITLNNPTREGYTFAGWTGTGLDAATETVTIAKGSGGNRSYTATWTIITYTITYNLGYGSVATANPTTYTVETETFTLNTPTWEHFNFTGWTGSNGDTPETTVTIEKGSIGDRTYTANYEVGPHDGTCGDNVYYLYDSTSKTLNIFGTGGMWGYNDFMDVPWNSYCDEITTIIIGNGVTHIGNSVFHGCNALTSIEIPASVTSIGGRAFEGCTGLTSITFGNSVTSIGDDAFVFCTGLTSVTFGNSVTSIGDRAFYGCTSLTSIEIPASVTSIGDRVFADCTSLTSITVASGNTKYHSEGNCIIETATKTLIRGCKTFVIPTGVTHIGECAFSGYTGLTSIEIPASVESIGDYAFYGCTGLTSITIPNSVTSIGVQVFVGCSGLESISVAGGNTVYDSRNGCNAIIETASNTLIAGCKNSVIPTGVTSIGRAAFLNCSALTSVTIPASVTSIGLNAFRECTSLTSIEIPASVTSIDDWAFFECSSLTSVTIYATTPPTLGDQAFADNASGRKIYVPMASLGTYQTNWSEYAGGIVGFSGTCGASGHETDVLWAYEAGTLNIFRVGSTGDMADYTEGAAPWNSYKGDITKVVIGNGVTHIGNNAFNGCNGLFVLISEAATTPSLGSNALDGCTLLNAIGVPSGTASAYKSATNWAAYADKIFAIDGTCGTGVYYSYDSTTKTLNIFGTETVWGYYDFMDVPWNSYCDEITTVVIGNGVTHIGDWGFYGCSSLTSITIPNSVTNIGGHAFYGCIGLTSITIPNSVTSIGYRAFYYCTGLTSVTFGNSVTSIDVEAFWDCTGLSSIEIPASVTSIGSGVFAGCTSLTSITVASGNTKYHSDGNCIIETATKTLIQGCKNSVIPDDVTSIGNHAFMGCTSLTSITIPNSVTSIGVQVFIGCSGLESISVAGGNTVYDSRNGCNAIIETASNTLIQGCKNTVIPTGVTSIGNCAFEGCGSLTSITIPNSVTSIDLGAFFGCTGLTSIEIPANVTSIGNSAFDGCWSLTSVIIYAPSLTTYGYAAFDNNKSGRKIYVPMASLGTYQTNWSAYAGDIVGLSFSYLDASGNTQYCTDFTVLDNTMNYLAEGWYVVNSDVTFTQTVTTTGDVNLILKDGCTMNVGTSSSRISGHGIQRDGGEKSLTIYSQSLGDDMGELNIYTDNGNKGIVAYAVTINGGNVTIDANGNWAIGICAGDEDITINGGNVSVTATGTYGMGLYAYHNVTINGGTVEASGTADGIRIDNGTIAINGGNVNASGDNTGENGYGINANYGYRDITLGWSKPTDRIYASSYSGTVTIAAGQSFINDAAMPEIVSGTITDMTKVNGKTLTPAIVLADNADNTSAIATAATVCTSGKTLAVQLQGRTLYKDGDWNTLCLPFALGNAMADEGHHFDGTLLEGATVKELDGSTSNLNSEGLLTLNFSDATSIEAGKPYIVKWASADNLVNPVFNGVNIINTEPTPVEFEFEGNSAKCQFVGNYAPLEITEATNRNNIVVLTSGSRLGYTTSDRTIAKGNALGAFRAYFYIPANGGSTSASSFELNFEDEETTSLSEELRVKSEEFLSGESVARNATATDWYTLDGRKLQGKPTQKGIYIYKGKKVKR